MITLHALAQSRAWRIAWLLELLGLEYEVKRLERDAETMLAPAQLRELHPLGKSPLIQDGDLVLAESGAIVEYLVNRYGADSALRPPANSPLWPQYLFWLHYAEGSLMPLLVMTLVFRKIDQTNMPFFARPIARRITDSVRQRFLDPQLRLHLGYVEQELAGKDWLLGTDTPTAADVMMSFALQAAITRSPQNWPNIAAYVQRIQADPHYQRAEQKLGKLDMLG